MKKIVSCLMLLMGIGWIVGGQTVYAEDNSMSLIEYDVKLLENGTGIVTEHRKMNMTDGTELYIEMNNLQGSEVTDFSVQGFSNNPDWDSNDSREEKAEEYEILEADDGVELVWGIGEYGEKEYELTYTITNMVRQLEDGQALNWNFNTYGEIAPEAMNIKINGPFDFTQKNVDIWGFGYEGIVELANGGLTSEAQSQLEADGRLVILMQFPDSPFDVTVQANQTLEEQLDKSQDGATYNGDGKLSGWLLSLILGIVLGIPSLLGIVFWRIEVRKKDAGRCVQDMRLKNGTKDKPMEISPILMETYLMFRICFSRFSMVPLKIISLPIF
ncbi:DUF2207 domain-containing protein [Marinilactibacillus psychrotolerans]|uniref:DUF2207 domain-containing protein n=1 Tax=Marinilactibacillus psychrotolerans TaxID=191770 RepID=UPI003885089A